MAVQLTQKISELISKYQTQEENRIQALENVLEKYKSPAYQKRYTQAGLREAIISDMATINNEGAKADQVMNQQLKAIIQDAKDQLLPQTPKKTADYSLKIGNALRFLEVEGDELTDEVAHSILKDFLDDLPQMALFERVVIRQLKGGSLENATPLEMQREFPKTFGALHRNNFLMNTLDEIDSLAENLFLHPKVNGQGIIINHEQFAVSISGYVERSHQDDIMKLAGIVDKITAPMA